MNSYVPNSILIKIKATHFNYINKNFLYYTENAVNGGAKSWTSPYNKPQLVGHNKKSDPIGRIIDYEVIKDSTEYPSDYILLTVRITDKDSIQKVLDGRYFTVSVGSKSSRVICSECNQILTEDGLCEHRKGTFNSKGEPIFWLIDQLNYTEDSFVNEPADEYTAITVIDIGNGWVEYKEFLDNRETILSNYNLEDNLMNEGRNKKLSDTALEKLPDSAFCYVSGSGDDKIRQFPAHDAVHIQNGLSHLSKADFSSDSAKSKIIAFYKRRARKVDLDVSDEYADIDETLGLEDGFTEEENKAINDFLKENPNWDKTSEENTDHEQENNYAAQSVDNKDIDNMKKNEAIEYAKNLQKKFNDEQEENKKAIDLRDAKIKKLEDTIKEKDTLILELEDESNRYLDQNALIEKKYRDAIIHNLIDLKLADNKDEERKDLIERYSTRKIESLLDALSDTREIMFQEITDSSEENRIEDPANTENESHESSNEDETRDKFDLFNQER